MKCHASIIVATAILALPLFPYAQNATDPGSQSMQNTQGPITGHREAVKMTRARAELLHTLDARKDHSGSEIQARLTRAITLTDGTALPSGTILVGKVTIDDMQHGGSSRLALRFNQAQLRDKTDIPVKVMIVAVYGPAEGDESEAWEASPVPNSWTDGTLQIDQIGVTGGVDLHSRISSDDSGVFVSTAKDEVKLQKGSEIQLAIGPGKDLSRLDQTAGDATSTTASVQK